MNEHLCTQGCGKPAFFQYGNSHRLCVDCNLKVQQAMELQQAGDARHLNYLTEEMEATVGLHGILPRYEVPVPKPTVHMGQPTFNNIKINNSVVGVVNTGQIKTLDLALTNIQSGGSPELAENLRKLTQAVVDAHDLDSKNKNEILEQLSFLAAQAATPENQRQKSVAGAILPNVERLLNASSSLVTLWMFVKPLLEKLLR